MISNTKLSQTITLKDGRRLGYAEVGNLGGEALFWFHGGGSSRFEIGFFEEIAEQCNIHVMGRLQFPTDIKYIKNLLDDANVTEDDMKRLKQEFFLYFGKETKKIKFRPLRVKDLGKTVQPGKSVKLSFKLDTSLKALIKDLNKLIIQTMPIGGSFIR